MTLDPHEVRLNHTRWDWATQGVIEPHEVRLSHTRWDWATPGEIEPQGVRLSHTRWDWATRGEIEPHKVRLSHTRWDWTTWGEIEPHKVRLSHTRWDWATQGEIEPHKVRLSHTRWDLATRGEIEPQGDCYSFIIQFVEMTMEQHIPFNRIFLLLLMTVCVAQARLLQNMFQKLEPGQNIRGKVVAELLTKSSQECSLRLSIPSSCTCYSQRFCCLLSLEIVTFQK